MGWGGVVVGEEEEYAGGYRLLRKQPDFSVCRSVGCRRC